LADTIRNETAAAFRDDGSVDTKCLVSKCPVFHSVWLETLRLSAASTAVRYIMEDTKVGNTVLPKGNALMYSARQLHLENNAFGNNHNEFDPLRFYNRPALEHISSFRPFGGGQTLCPGRHLAKHMLFTFVATTLRRYDLTLAFPQRFPRYKECKPSIGIISGHDDLIFEAKERIV
jgi:cytochrome P450